MNNEQKLKIGGRYLIRKQSYYSNEIYEVVIVEITEKAIKFLRNESYYWKSKEEFYELYEIFEEINNC